VLSGEFDPIGDRSHGLPHSRRARELIHHRCGFRVLVSLHNCERNGKKTMHVRTRELSL